VTRVLLVLACVALVLLAVWGMRVGWRHRGERQADLPELPTVPELGEPRLAPAAGLYVGTTFAASWQDRVVRHGLGSRAAATVALYPEGVLVDRVGAVPVFIPTASGVDVRLAPGLAGKVGGEGGLLVVRWGHGTAEVDTGFRADERRVYPDWIREFNSLTGHVSWSNE